MIDYAAGIDLGTTYAAAAVYTGELHIVPLADPGPMARSAVAYDTQSGSWLVGDDAAQSGLPLFERFKRSLGTKAELSAGIRRESATTLLQHQLEWVLDRLEDHMGGRPTSIALTHPANWGAHRQRELGSLGEAAFGAGPALITEPVAVAIHHASRSPMATGRILAVYDLGGGTTDVAVLRKDAERFTLLGASGVDEGGLDFDDVIAELIEERLDYPLEVDTRDLLRTAKQAKETLSQSEVAEATVLIGGEPAHVELTKADVEAVLRSGVVHGVGHLSTALSSAGVTPEDLDSILLAGGGAAIPLLKQSITEHIGRPIEREQNPKLSVAYGAAIAAAAAGDLLKEPTTLRKQDKQATGSPQPLEVSGADADYEPIVQGLSAGHLSIDVPIIPDPKPALAPLPTIDPPSPHIHDSAPEPTSTEKVLALALLVSLAANAILLLMG